MRDSELLEAWEGRIADYRSSGLTLARWCEKTGFSVGQTKYWITKINKQTRTNRSSVWARLDVVDSSKADSQVTVRIGVARIEVRPGFDRSLLSEVLSVVASTC